MARKQSAGTKPEKPTPSVEGPGLVEQLREAIRKSGESLNQLGERSGLDSARLSRFMRGERDLTLSAAEKLCQALGLELSDSRPRHPKPKKSE
jgi:transcriptional regulator with XRE-family HTH domain